MFRFIPPLQNSALQTTLSVRWINGGAYAYPRFRFTSPGATNILPHRGRCFVPSAFCFCWLKASFQASCPCSKYAIHHSSLLVLGYALRRSSSSSAAYRLQVRSTPCTVFRKPTLTESSLRQNAVRSQFTSWQTAY